MNILLVAINASYSHTCLSVRALYNYVVEKGGACPSLQPASQSFTTPSSGPQTPVRNARCKIGFSEFTINQPVGDILRGIAACEPDLVLFSTYIWNAEITAKIIPDIKKILPSAVVGAGGPEFGFAPDVYFKKLPSLDFICFGEGEKVLLNLIHNSQCAMPNCCSEEFFVKAEVSDFNREIFLKGLKSVKGIYFRQEDYYSFAGEETLICDLSELPFAYPELIERPLPEGYVNKIYYYESSRGCPYACSYCMSSLDKRVRFMPLERVYKDLQIFLDAKVPLVKFVDRTYNLQPERYIAIWKYILENHNGITMFHFEIEAEYLSAEALEFLQNVPAGVMQFEIGVQSANKKTLEAVHRSPNVEKLAENVSKVPRTIHQHLDLIAGLPYEDMESFGKSFDFVMALKPDALQLGFLKVLHGTQMEEYASRNGWKWMENPVYETFSTPYLSYTEMLFLKDLEVVVDAYSNSGKFPHVMNYIGRTSGSWHFFYKITEWGQEKGVFSVARRETYWFEILNIFAEDKWVVAGKEPEMLPAQRGSEQRSANVGQAPSFEIISNLLRYDFVLRGKQGGWPQWYDHRYNKERHRDLLEKNGGVKNARLDFAHSEYEVFDFDVDAEFPEKNAGMYEKLIRYN